MFYIIIAVVTCSHWLSFFVSVFLRTHTTIGLIVISSHENTSSWLAFKLYNSRADPFWKRSTSLYVRWKYKARFVTKRYSHNTAYCYKERKYVVFAFPVSMVYAWNAWDHNVPFGDQLWRMVAFYDTGFPTEARVNNVTTLGFLDLKFLINK